jgi:hypothetical protein
MRLDVRPRLPWIAVAAGAMATAGVATVAADSRWLAALGKVILDRGSIPDGVPFASADTHGWPNVPVVAEVLFRGLFAVPGDRGALAAQVLAVAAMLALLAVDMRRAGAGDRAAFCTLLLLLPTGFAALVAIRSQLFSLALFPLLALLLRAEHRRPSRRIWAIVPLLAVWSNLHGAALTGAAVAGAYLVFDRARREPAVAIGVLVASLLALCLTPALWDTPSYYRGVLENEAARQGFGLWAPIGLGVIDLVLAAGLVFLCLFAVRARPPLWELVALVGLAVLTVRAARGGIFLGLFAAVPAAYGLGGPAQSRPRLAAPVVLSFALLTLAALGRGPLSTTASHTLVTKTLAGAGGTPVLAQDALAEQVALDGGTVWVSNPIDAFRRADQRTYVDWLRAVPAGDAALAHAPRAVLVRRGGDVEARLSRNQAFREAGRDAHAVLFLRR